jgi:hypothetical protein
MNTIKQFLSHLFASKWYYNQDMSMRIHKDTGNVEYRWSDGRGNWYEQEPMWGE